MKTKSKAISKNAHGDKLSKKCCMYSQCISSYLGPIFPPNEWSQFWLNLWKVRLFQQSTTFIEEFLATGFAADPM